jgi:hypothetical protein
MHLKQASCTKPERRSARRVFTKARLTHQHKAKADQALDRTVSGPVFAPRWVKPDFMAR